MNRERNRPGQGRDQPTNPSQQPGSPGTKREEEEEEESGGRREQDEEATPMPDRGDQSNRGTPGSQNR
jgi:hypothetical protein